MNEPLQMEHWPIGQLIEYARNPVNNAQAVDQMVGSLKEFGFRIPVLAQRDGLVVDGHLRLKAAKKLGMTHVPVVLADGMTAAQIKAFRLMTRNSAKWADWDQDLLKLELADLGELDFDLNLTGFDQVELDQLLQVQAAPSGEGDGAGDDDPPLPLPIVTQPGDVWRLGAHRLGCGDAADPAMVQQVLAGQRVELCFTSPPYTMKRDYETNVANQDWDGLMDGVFRWLTEVLRPDGQVLVNLGMQHEGGEWTPYWEGWIQRMRDWGWRRFGWYIWDQGAGLFGDWHGRFAPAHEFIFHFNRQARAPNKFVPCVAAGQIADRALRGTIKGRMNEREAHNEPGPIADFKVPDSVVRIERRGNHAGCGDHPAVFPVKLPEFFMQAYTHKGGTVYEPFSGSGTTLIAAERLGRVAYALDIAPKYVDIALLRFQEMTGREAILERTGETFLDVRDRLYP